MRRLVQSGLGLVEVLVGMLVTLVVAVAMLDVFARVEGYKRSAVASADTEQAGAVAAFLLGNQIANAGHGLGSAARELASCPDTGDARSSLRPMAIVIQPGAGSEVADAFVAVFGASASVGVPLPLADPAVAGAALRVRAPMGIATGDRIVVVDGAGHCHSTVAAGVSPPDSGGVVEVVRADASAAAPASSLVVDLGPDERVRRVRYDVVDGVLRSHDLARAGATPSPLASGIVNMKLQYGIDTTGDGALDAWVPAQPPWDPASVLAASAETLARIKAIRLGLVVGGDAPDPRLATPFDWVLFDCAQDDKTRCAGRLSGTLPAGGRYRTIETAIALRNIIWNAAP